MSYCGNIVKYNQALQIVRDKLAKNAGAKSFVSTQTSIPIGITLKNTIKLLRVSEFIEERKNFTWKSFTRFLGMLPTGIVLKKQSVGDTLRRHDAMELSYRYNSTLSLRTYNHTDLHVLGLSETI